MKKMLLCIIGAAIVLAGCFKKAPINRYYLLDYVPTPPKVKNRLAIRPVTLRIKDFKIAEAYKRSEIVYRKSSHEMQFYNFHQWAVKPEYLVTDMVFKHLRAANLFKAISRSIVDFNPDYTLSGEVIALEEYDSKDKWYAHLAISFQLIHTTTEKQLWGKTYDVRKEVARQEPVYVVRELSSLLEYITDQAIMEIRNLLPRYSLPQEVPKSETKKDIQIEKHDVPIRKKNLTASDSISKTEPEEN